MKHLFIEILFSLILLTSCKKDWLEGKPNDALVIPSTPQDYQSILDNTGILNINYPTLGELSSDDLNLSYSSWQALPTHTEKNAYIWAPDVYQGENFSDWNPVYQMVFSSNIVLDGIAAQPSSAQLAYSEVKGEALFFRAMAFYQLAQEFCKPYNASTAASDPGIVLRLSSDVKKPVVRSTVAETYTQMLSDATNSVALLPNRFPFATRPVKAAAYALLSRMYLLMKDYTSSVKYTDSAISLHPQLLNYNTLNPSASFPFVRFNDEVVFHARGGIYPALTPSYMLVDSTLYVQYDSNDLRKSLYFIVSGGPLRYKGSYDHSSVFFTGIATDELYLIRAENKARLGNTQAAMDDLNTLLVTRWKTGTFIPYTAASPVEALHKILTERRKELCFRNLRWTDLRRLNMEAGFEQTLTRNLNGTVYRLPPNDPRYTLPIPDVEIQLSGLVQNPR